MRLIERIRPRLTLSLAMRLSRGWWRLHTLAALVFLALRKHPRIVWVRITLPSGACRQFYLNDYTQAQALGEVLLDGIYDVKPDYPVCRIVDLGANAGQAAVYLRDLFPDAHMLAVEADPATAQVTALNLRDDQKTAVVAVAVADRDGAVTFTSLASRGWSWGSNVLAAGTPADAPTVTIPCVTLDTLLSDHGFEGADLLKVDIEGSELMLTAGTALRRIGCVVGEAHPHMLGVPTEEIAGQLREHGNFDLAQILPGEIFVLRRSHPL